MQHVLSRKICAAVFREGNDLGTPITRRSHPPGTASASSAASLRFTALVVAWPYTAHACIAKLNLFHRHADTYSYSRPTTWLPFSTARRYASRKAAASAGLAFSSDCCKYRFTASSTYNIKCVRPAGRKDTTPDE